MTRVILVFMVCVSISAFAGPPPAQQKESKLPVFVSILPQAYFLERVGGHHVDVQVLVGEGQSPATYEPTPKQMARLATAKAYFRIGVPFEKGIMRKTKQLHKQLVVVDTQKGITHRYLAGHKDDHDTKGNEMKQGFDGRKTPDPHVWMDPKLVKIQSQNIRDALCRLDTLHCKEYTTNMQEFMSDLDLIDKRIAGALMPLKGKNMYVFHPAFGYFADSYGLHQIPIEIEGKEPTAKQLANIINRATKEGVRVLFVQPQFSPKSAEAVAQAIGGVVIPLNPLARDYLANITKVATAIEHGIH